MKWKSFTLLALLCLSLFACTVNNNENDGAQQNIEYAKGFSIFSHPNYKELIVWNPWSQGKVYARYFLVKSDTVSLPQAEAQKILIPLKKTAISSATHVAFINQLQLQSTIKGLCSPQLIYDSILRAETANKSIADLGDPLQINVENTLHLQPDAFFTVGYNSTDNSIEQIKKTNIPVIYSIEWMEHSLLARAEWIKFIAAFFDQETLADSIFNEVKSNYEQLTMLTQNVSEKPTIMSGGNFRGTWYMPAGNSYMGQLFRDAGASYHYADNPQTGSIPLTIEEVMAHFANADVWVGSSANSLHELELMDSKHTLFKAFKEKRIYNFNKRTTPQGANDFWELGLTRPDLLLADLISILHPNLLPNHATIFTTQLQ